MDDGRIKVKVTGGRLVISIGTARLAHAFSESESNQTFREMSGENGPLFRVTNIGTFAMEVARVLKDEEEDGSTGVHRMLDAACMAAVENGCDGVEEV